MSRTRIEELAREKIQLGHEVENFFGRKIGKYLIERIISDREAAWSRLGTADTSDPKQMRDIQNDFNIPNLVLMWLGEAVSEGKAHLELDRREGLAKR